MTTEENKLPAVEEKENTSSEEINNESSIEENEIKVDFDKVALALSLGESNFDSGNEMCTNKECRFMGTLIKKKRSKNIVIVILFLLQALPLLINYLLQPESPTSLKMLIAFPIFGILPALAYQFFHSGNDTFCPKCGTQVNKG